MFPQFRKTQSEVAALQGLYWEIVNHLKILFDAFEPEDIAGWESAYVDAGANAGIAVGSIPDEYLFNLTVKAQIKVGVLSGAAVKSGSSKWATRGIPN